MRPLRELIARAIPPRELGPVEPVALLSAVVREAPTFDPADAYDRDLFGMTTDELATLGPVLPYICEVAFEALERSGVRFDRLRTFRCATYLGVSDPHWVTPRDAPFLADLFGMPGPAHTVLEVGAGFLTAVHHAAQALRAGDIELALVASDHLEGVAAAVLTRIDQVNETGRVRALLLATASNRAAEEVTARGIAAVRAGLEEKVLVTVAPVGASGLVDAIAQLDRGETRPLAVSEDGDASSVVVVVGVAEEGSPAETPPRILGLSARSPGALRSLVRDSLDRMATADDLYGMSTEALARPEFEYRLAMPIRSLDDARTRLDGWLQGQPGRVAAGYAMRTPVAFIIPPAGAQFAGMGDVLYGSEPVFREALNRCDRALRALLPRPLLTVLFPAPGRDPLVDEPIYANPLTFSFAFALSELYRSRGLVADAVIGCGVGELAAAAIAGAIDVEDAARVAAERGRLLGTLSVEAARAVIGANEETVRDLIGTDADEVDIVALPMPDRTVIGGAVNPVQAVIERAASRGLLTQQMAGHPNNTPLVEPIVAAFTAASATLKFETPEMAWVSTSSGRRTEHADANHWATTLRGPIRFAQSVETLYALGCRAFIELAPRATVLPAGERILDKQDAHWFAALDPAGDDLVQTEELLSAQWVLGGSVTRGPGGRFPGAAELPTYRWDRKATGEGTDAPSSAQLNSAVTSVQRGLAWVPEIAQAPVSSLSSGPTPSSAITVMPADDRVPGNETPDGPGASPAGTDDRVGVAIEPPFVSQGLVEAMVIEDDTGPRDLLELPSEANGKDESDAARPSPKPAVLRLPEGVAFDTALANANVDLEDEGDLTLEDLTIPAVPAPMPPLGAPALEADPTAGFFDDFEDIEVDSYAGREPRTLAEAEEAADAEVLWEERWVVDELPEAASADPTTWVILADRGGVGDYLSTLLGSSGNKIVRVLNEAPYPREDRTMFVPDPTEVDAWEPVVEALGTLYGTLRILHLWALDLNEEEELDPKSGWAGLVGLLRELLSQQLPARVHLVTRGAVRAPDGPTAHAGGSLWGLAGSLAVEAPYLFGGIVDLDPDDEDPDALLRHLLAGGTDATPVLAGAARSRPEHVFRNGQRWRRTVERVQNLPDPRPLDAEGAWVISGDVDSGALELAHWFSANGVRRIYLISANPPPAEVLRGVLDLQRKGVGCIVVRADPADARDVAQIKTRMRREPKIEGIVLRIAAEPRQLTEIALDEAVGRWRRAIAMSEVMRDLAKDANRWVWSEGRALDGIAGGGVPAIIGAAIAARVRTDMARGGVSTVIHSGPISDLSPGQTVRLVTRLGPMGGIHGVWRER